MGTNKVTPGTLRWLKMLFSLLKYIRMFIEDHPEFKENVIMLYSAGIYYAKPKGFIIRISEAAKVAEKVVAHHIYSRKEVARFLIESLNLTWYRFITLMSQKYMTTEILTPEEHGQIKKGVI